MPIPEILAGFTALRDTAKMLNGVAEIANDLKVQSVLIDLQGKILDLQGKFLGFQSEYETLAKINRELEATLSKNQQWEKSSSAYAMKEIAPGILVYALNQQFQNQGPKHFLCPHCFIEKKASILQRIASGAQDLKCPSCKLELMIEGQSSGCIGWTD